MIEYYTSLCLTLGFYKTGNKHCAVELMLVLVECKPCFSDFREGLDLSDLGADKKIMHKRWFGKWFSSQTILTLPTKNIWRHSSLCVLILHKGFVNRVVAVKEKKDFPNHTTYTNAKNIRKRTIVSHVSREPLVTRCDVMCHLCSFRHGISFSST